MTLVTAGFLHEKDTQLSVGGVLVKMGANCKDLLPCGKQTPHHVGSSTIPALHIGEVFTYVSYVSGKQIKPMYVFVRSIAQKLKSRLTAWSTSLKGILLSCRLLLFLVSLH